VTLTCTVLLLASVKVTVPLVVGLPGPLTLNATWVASAVKIVAEPPFHAHARVLGSRPGSSCAEAGGTKTCLPALRRSPTGVVVTDPSLRLDRLTVEIRNGLGYPPPAPLTIATTTAWPA